MLINKAYKTELQVNNKQASYFTECAGAMRKIYNWGLSYWIEEHNAGKKRSSWRNVIRELTKLKHSEFIWLYKYPQSIAYYALKNCDKGYQKFFRDIENGKKASIPKFKSKKHSNAKFTINGEKVKVEEAEIQLPIVGSVRLKEHGYIPVNKKIVSVTIFEKCKRWYICVNIEEEVEEKNAFPEHVIGVDLGIKHLAVTSDGVCYENPKLLDKYKKKLKLLDRRVSRKVEGSKNREKAKLEKAKLHAKIARMRKYNLNKITTELAKTKSVIVIEDLAVSEMYKNHYLAKAIGDTSFAEFRRMLEYKCPKYGSKLVVVDRFFPSSKTCSNCGVIKDDLTLKDRTFKCSDCGFEIDRDLNAALNLKARAKYAQSYACGEDISPAEDLQATSLKQEAGSNATKSVNPAYLLWEILESGETGGRKPPKVLPVSVFCDY
jgi:putative transposase